MIRTCGLHGTLSTNICLRLIHFAQSLPSSAIILGKCRRHGITNILIHARSIVSHAQLTTDKSLKKTDLKYNVFVFIFVHLVLFFGFFLIL